MARYLSRAARFKKTGRHAQNTLINSPGGTTLQETLRPIICLFSQGGVTEWEKQLARERFDMRGISEGETVERRFSVYDTDEQASSLGWDAETKAQVEHMLDSGQGIDYFRVEQPKAPAPWPSYDTTVAHRIVDTAEAIGVSLESVLLYEKENENRPEVIAGIEAALEVEQEVVVSA